MCPAYRDNRRPVRRSGQPVRQLLAYQPARTFRVLIGSRWPPGDDQHHPVPLRDGIAQSSFKRCVRGHQIMTMQINRHIRRNPSGCKAPVPAPVQRVGDGRWNRRRFFVGQRLHRPPRRPCSGCRGRQRIRRNRRSGYAMQRTDSGRHPRPERGLVSVQPPRHPSRPQPRRYGSPFPWAAAAPHGPLRSFRRPPVALRCPHPRRYRNDWRP